MDSTKIWTEVNSADDIEKLLNLYGFFHDGCLKDVYISTREYIDERLAMSFGNILEASLLFQRQYRPNSVLELKFEEVVQFNFLPFTENESSILYNATLKVEDGLYYWADFEDWEKGDNDSIWICGKRLYWRLRPELIGNIKRVSLE